MRLLVKNIGTLVGIDESGRLRVCGSDMANIATLEGAWLLAEEGRICDYGTMDNLPSEEGCEVLDAEGGWLFPSFCDSHTHIVYAGSREQEFLDKINGLSYEEIAKRGGGILNSADRLHETSEDELYRQAMERIDEIIKEAWAAWDKSKTDYEKKKAKQQGIPGSSGEDGESSEGVITIKMEQQREEVICYGDPRYLEVGHKNLIKRRKLLGLYSPEKKEISGDLSFTNLLMQTGIVDEEK